MKTSRQSLATNYLLNFALIATVAAIAACSYYFFTQKRHILLKTNRAQTILTTQEKLFPVLYEAAQIYLFNKYLPTWKRGKQPTLAEKKEHRKILKYKPHIEHIIDEDPNIVINHQRPTLFLHGWGDTRHSAKLLKAFCDILPGDMVTFNFRDQGVIIPKIRRSNLGQLPDVLSTLFTLKWMKDTLKISEVDLFGYSRGGATLLNSIAVLNDKNGTYDEALAQIGINAHERAQLLTMIQRGCHVLNCPLTDMNVSIESRVKNGERWIKFLELCSKYKRDGLQGLNSATQFAGLALNMLVHFQYNDSIVSNNNETELYCRLASHNPKDTYLVLGDNGGHLHSHAALAHTIHAFKKNYGGSYDPKYVDQYYATEQQQHLSNLLLRPGAQADEIINSFHEQCAADMKKC